MCEALIRVVDKSNPDPYLDCKLFKRGDVVDVHEDGWKWGAEELTNPHWRIVKFTSISVAQAESFLNPEADADPAHPSRMLRRRAFAFDVGALTLPAAFRTWLNDASRAQPTRTVTLTGAQLLALRVTKTPVPDPNVIG